MNENINDWQNGSKSKMNSLDRMIYHTQWLKQQHEQMKKLIDAKIVVEDKPIQGFVKD